MKNFKTALITGGAQRIGSSITEHLAKNGCNVAVQFNSSEEKIISLRKKINRIGVKFEAFQANFNTNFDYENFFKSITKKLGYIDLLINNSSSFEFDSIKKTNYKIFDNHINVNLKAPFFLSKNFVDNLKDKNGLIINIIDQRVKNITPYFTSYTLSKTALYTLTKSLSVFLAPRIRVNGISPGPTLKSKNQTVKQFREQVKRTPMMKQVKLSEINNAIDYLIANQSITGEVLTIDSGQSLGWANSKSKVFSTD